MDAAAELGRNPVSKHEIQHECGDEQADVGRDCRTRLAGPNFRHERGQGNIHVSCSDDHVQDWQPYPIDPYSCYMCDHTYCCTHRSRAMRILLIYSTKVSKYTAESYNYLVTGCRCSGIIYVLCIVYMYFCIIHRSLAMRALLIY